MTRTQQDEARRMIARSGRQGHDCPASAPERVQTALATFRESGRSAQTCNHYRACIRALVRWAWTTGRLRENPLVGLTGYNAKEDRRHDRRTLSLDELQRLIECCRARPGTSRA